jgi:hypothetical protein
MPEKPTLPLKTGSCRARTRSYQKEREQQAVAKADSQIDSQALRDPDLARVANAWPSLPPNLKAAVLAMVGGGAGGEK